ncbi:MAG TPA: hypothetical protein VJI74_01775 [Candidatus Paceibacterota bacterium]
MRILRTHHYGLTLWERWWRKHLEKKAQWNLREHKELWAELSSYKERSQAAGASYADYWLLYRLVRTMKPKEILECGTGVTTIAMAMALRDNERLDGIQGRITSMEDKEEYFNKARELLPKHLSPYVDIVQSPKVERTYYLFRGVQYKGVPDRAYEFVYVDGPKTSTPDSTPEKRIKTFNADLITVLERSTKPLYALVDTRTSTSFVYQMIFREGKVRFEYAREIGMVGPVTKADLLTTDQMIRQLGPHPIKRFSLFRDPVSFFKI